VVRATGSKEEPVEVLCLRKATDGKHKHNHHGPLWIELIELNQLSEFMDSFPMVYNVAKQIVTHLFQCMQLHAL
jgi:hypothetical protein